MEKENRWEKIILSTRGKAWDKKKNMKQRENTKVRHGHAQSEKEKQYYGVKTKGKK